MKYLRINSYTFYLILILSFVVNFILLLTTNYTDMNFNLTAGNDENTVKLWANIILNNNLLSSPFTIPGYIGSLHFGSAYILAIIDQIGLDYYYYFYFKFLIKILTCLFLYSELKKTSENLARLVTAFVLIYPPFYLFGLQDS